MSGSEGDVRTSTGLFCTAGSVITPFGSCAAVVITRCGGAVV
jgi:hypothetical protein